MTQSPLSDAVKMEAVEWMARLRSDQRSASVERDFRDWLHRDPAHARAFEDLNLIWESAGGYARDLRLAPQPPHRPVLARRAVMAGLVAVPVVGATLTMLRPARAETYRTGVGEQQHIVLADDTQVFLDTNTSIEVAFSRDARTIGLQYGRANFQVTPDSSRPFIVTAAGREVIAQASNFDVRCDKNQVSVVLFSGQAAVKEGDKTSALSAGERLATDEPRTATLDKPRLAALGAWRSGHTIFEDTKLSEAVAEMNRYNAFEMQIRDRQIGELRVSGVYRNGDSVAFANTIAKLMPVKVVTTPTHLILLEDDTRAKKGG